MVINVEYIYSFRNEVRDNLKAIIEEINHNGSCFKENATKLHISDGATDNFIEVFCTKEEVTHIIFGLYRKVVKTEQVFDLHINSIDKIIISASTIRKVNLDIAKLVLEKLCQRMNQKDITIRVYDKQ